MGGSIRASPAIVADYERLFVNRGAYTLQTFRPNPDSGRHYYFRPKAKGTGEELTLTACTIRRHLEGELTIGLYAINPATQRSKWVANADYAGAMEDLLKLQYFLQQDQVQAALEMSRRGGHLWIFMEQPALARECRALGYSNSGPPVSVGRYRHAEQAGISGASRPHAVPPSAEAPQ
jgi:hypothetical protein